MLERQRVGHGGHLAGIAPQHRDLFRSLVRVGILLVVALTEKVGRGHGRRLGAMREELDHHRSGFPSPSTASAHDAVAVGGVRGGTAPRQPLQGTREAWPQRVCWLID